MHAATQWLGEDQPVAVAGAAFVPELCRIRLAVDGETRGHLWAFDGVATDQGAAGCVQFPDGSGHHPLQVTALQARVVPGQGNVGQG